MKPEDDTADAEMNEFRLLMTSFIFLLSVLSFRFIQLHYPQFSLIIKTEGLLWTQKINAFLMAFYILFLMSVLTNLGSFNFFFLQPSSQH